MLLNIKITFDSIASYNIGTSGVGICFDQRNEVPGLRVCVFIYFRFFLVLEDKE